MTSPIGKKVAGSNIETGSVEEEDEFVTPRENFGSSWKKAAQKHEGEGTRARIRSCGKQVGKDILFCIIPQFLICLVSSSL